jgi:hypothetical protein
MCAYTFVIASHGPAASAWAEHYHSHFAADAVSE